MRGGKRSRPERRRFCALAFALFCVLGAGIRPAHAGLADTLPQYGMILETRYGSTLVDRRYNSRGEEVNLAKDLERFAPTGEFQGTLTVPGTHETEFLLTRLAVGVTDDLTFAAIIPFFLSQKTKLNLGWKGGSYIPEFDRVMTEDDFWQWAASMGQPRPPDWEAKYRLGDVILALVYNLYRTPETRISTMLFGNTFTASDAPPEDLGSIGTSGYDLVTNGDLGFHLPSDWRLPTVPFLDRFTLSIDIFYEHYFPREFETSRGTKNPLISMYAPYVGKTYEVKRGDLWGGGAALRFDLIQGPTEPTWLTRKHPEMQDAMPTVLGLLVVYNHQRAFDTDYTSRSRIWDSAREEETRALYKHNFLFSAQLSGLRYGLPFDIFGGYLTQTLIPGNNFRPMNGFDVGIRVYYSLKANPLDLFRGGSESPGGS